MINETFGKKLLTTINETDAHVDALATEQHLPYRAVPRPMLPLGLDFDWSAEP